VFNANVFDEQKLDDLLIIVSCGITFCERHFVFSFFLTSGRKESEHKWLEDIFMGDVV